MDVMNKLNLRITTLFSNTEVLSICFQISRICRFSFFSSYLFRKLLRHLCATIRDVQLNEISQLLKSFKKSLNKQQRWWSMNSRWPSHTARTFGRDVNETFSFETRPRPRHFSRCRKRYSLLSFWLQTSTDYAVFVHLLRKTQFSISNCSTETFAPFSQRLSAI